MPMIEFYQGRALRYEIYARLDARWQLVAAVKDDRESLRRPFERADFQALEAEVQNKAEAILAQRGVEAVRVVRERVRKDGFSAAEEIFNREAEAPPKIERRHNSYDGAAPLCRRAEDLLARPARRVIGLSLRPLLDQLGDTVLELLTIDGNNRSVTRASDAIAAVIGRVAQLQCDAAGSAVADKPPGGVEAGGVRARIDEIDRFVQELRTRIKQAESAPMPALAGPAGLDDFVAACAVVGDPAAARFDVFRGLCLALRRLSDLPRLDAALVFAEAASTPPALDALDDVLADLVDHPATIQEMLGPQRDLCRALEQLAQLAAGRASPDEAGPAPRVSPAGSFARMSRLIALNPWPKLTAALQERILASLQGKAALTHGQSRDEWQALDHLEKRLAVLLPGGCGGGIEQALERRRRQIQDAAMAQLDLPC